MDIITVLKNIFDFLVSIGINPIVAAIVLVLGAAQVIMWQVIKKLPLPKIMAKYFFLLPFITSLIFGVLLSFVIKGIVPITISNYLFGAIGIFCIGHMAFKFRSKWYPDDPIPEVSKDEKG